MSEMLSFEIGMKGDWMVTRVRANPEGTEAGAEVLICTNPSWPDSYTEFMVLSSIFTEAFMKASGDAMAELIGQMIAENPGVEAEAKPEIIESARLAGFSEEEAIAISEMDFPVVPRCDVCNAVDETVEWCGECGCCVVHCQQGTGCPTRETA